MLHDHNESFRRWYTLSFRYHADACVKYKANTIRFPPNVIIQCDIDITTYRKWIDLVTW